MTADKGGERLVRELVEWEYTRAGTADEFYATHRDLNPVAVVPLIEYATPFAARLAERFGLPGASLGAAQILRDKALPRKVRAAGPARRGRPLECLSPPPSAASVPTAVERTATGTASACGSASAAR